MKTKLVSWTQTIRDGKIVTIEERISTVSYDEIVKKIRPVWKWEEIPWYHPWKLLRWWK